MDTTATPTTIPAPTTMRAALDHTRRRALEYALQRSGGEVAAAARELGMSRRAAHKTIERLGVDVEAIRAAANAARVP